MHAAPQVLQLNIEPEYPGHTMIHYTQRRSNHEGSTDWMLYSDRDEWTRAMSKRKCKGPQVGMYAMISREPVNDDRVTNI